MIHIITQHFATDAWFEIQKKHIEKYTTDKLEYRVYLIVYKTQIPSDFKLPSNYEIINLNEYQNVFNEHYSIIETCYDMFIRDRIADDDIVVYMDSDAFPINNWTPKLKEYLLDNTICAVYRYEDRGTAQPDEYYPYPHLCFFSYKKKDRELYGFRHELPPGYPCPGFTINDLVRKYNLKVKQLTRSNKFNNHPTMFGIYDDMIYHQSSGSRSIIGRPYQTGGGASPDHRSMCYEGIDFYHRTELDTAVPGIIEGEISDVNLQIWFVIYDKIKNDESCNFLRRYYLGKN